jgi:hypothetical protein
MKYTASHRVIDLIESKYIPSQQISASGDHLLTYILAETK